VFRPGGANPKKMTLKLVPIIMNIMKAISPHLFFSFFSFIGVANNGVYLKVLKHSYEMEEHLYIKQLILYPMVLRQLTKEQAKEEVKKLVDKYNRIIESGSINRYKEEEKKIIEDSLK